jgi:hypothetical protein
MKDLTFENGDLLTTWVEGNTAISNSVKRRLATHPVTYSRAVKVSEGTKLLDTNFGSNLRQYLSYPDSEFGTIDFAEIVLESLSSDADINLRSVEVDGTNIKIIFKSLSADREILTTI